MSDAAKNYVPTVLTDTATGVLKPAVATAEILARRQLDTQNKRVFFDGEVERARGEAQGLMAEVLAITRAETFATDAARRQYSGR